MKMPIFQSSLGPGMRGFIELRQSLGYQVRTLAILLAHFDRYVVMTGYCEAWLSRNLVEGWVASTALLKPSSRAHRLYAMRALGRYLAQTHPQTYVPGPIAGPPRTSTFRPHIYTATEIQSLLNESRTAYARGILAASYLRHSTQLALLHRVADL